MKCGWNKDTAKNRKAGSLPSYAKNIERVAKQSKLLRGIGQFSIALDVAHSGFKIHEACTVGREEECTKMKYTEGGRLTGSLIGGSAGVYGSYALCNLAFGLETAGTSLLWCALVSGGAGAYAGGTIKVSKPVLIFTRFLKMIDSIVDFYYSDTFALISNGFFLVDGFLCIVVSIWIGRNSFMKKMDLLFLGHSIDSGIRLNLLDAGSYGTAMLFPKSYGKRVYKHVDISAISLKDKWPYMLYTSILLSCMPYMISGAYIWWNK